jgi:hypothetical protein
MKAKSKSLLSADKSLGKSGFESPIVMDILDDKPKYDWRDMLRSYGKGREQGKKDAEEAYKTRYSVLNLCHKTIATDRVSQDNLIRKQTFKEVLKEYNKIYKQFLILCKPITWISGQREEFIKWLEQELKKASK